ncbi:MAG: hypothetical protein ABS76_26495 [Pelagibacterium sp. SCN 64-44]|nr:MAG: hypothetical protein ABS76_26495 [Pelagibacterium sp. SCN 64-44]
MAKTCTALEMVQAAQGWAQYSPNRSRKTGAAIFWPDGSSMGDCNNFPSGKGGRIRDLDERHEGEARYLWIEHAERNVLMTAARYGSTTDGATMATPWFPCVECARCIVGAGIAKLVCTEPDWSEARYNFRIAETILREGGVEIEFVTLQA